MRLHSYQNILQFDDITIAVTIYTVINEQDGKTLYTSILFTMQSSLDHLP
jgi:hypothetical protein